MIESLKTQDHPPHVHFMGLGGIGVSALARILVHRGYIVSGCDILASHITTELADLGVSVFEGHDGAHLDGVDILVISAAVSETSAERVEARQRGIAMMKRANLLGELTRHLKTIAVAGTHGKTTTSSLIASLLLDAGLDPTAFVGGHVPALGGNTRDGGGDWAVIEADEYDRSFLQLSPTVAVITNVEQDHLEYYGTFDAIKEAFAAFMQRVNEDGAIIVCGEELVAVDLASASGRRVVTYGFIESAAWHIRDLEIHESGAHFSVRLPTGDCLPVRTTLSGRHNVLNSVAAIAAAHEAGVPIAGAISTLAHFVGPKRRQERRGLAPGGALVIDDYAHHPTEIKATLAGLRAQFPSSRLCVAFQPHTFSRTRLLLHETSASFSDANAVVIAPIYPAREPEPQLGAADYIHGSHLATLALEHHSTVVYVDDESGVVNWLRNQDRPGSILVTMGAGDIWKAGDELVSGR